MKKIFYLFEILVFLISFYLPLPFGPDLHLAAQGDEIASYESFSQTFGTCPSPNAQEPCITITGSASNGTATFSATGNIANWDGQQTVCPLITYTGASQGLNASGWSGSFGCNNNTQVFGTGNGGQEIYLGAGGWSAGTISWSVPYTGEPNEISYQISWSSNSISPAFSGSTIAVVKKTYIDLVASPTSLQSGQGTTLNWTSNNLSSCTASASPSNSSWSGSKTISGSQTISNLTSATTFTLNCISQGGESLSDSVVVTVTGLPAPPITANLTASATTITQGQNTTLTWDSTNATSCIGSSSPPDSSWNVSKSLSGNQSVSPATTTTYTITCNRPGGTPSDTATSSVTITVTTAGSATVSVSSNIPTSWTISCVPLGGGSTQSLTGSGEGGTYTFDPGLNGSSCDINAVAQNGFSLAITNSVTGSGSSFSIYPGENESFTLNYVAIPQNLSAQAVCSYQDTNTPGFLLSWDKVNGLGGYNTYYSTSANGTYTLSGSVGNSGSSSRVEAYIPLGNNTFFVDTTYYFKVSFYTGYVESGQSNSASVSASSQFVDNCFAQNAVPTVNLTASPESISQGQSSTLSWTSTNTTSCSAVSPAGWTPSTAVSGSQQVPPSVTTTYTISCSGPNGTASDAATVTVGVEPPGGPTLTVTSNVSTSWTINVTPLDGASGSILSGSGTSQNYSISPSAAGTLYAINPASQNGCSLVVTNSTGSGSSVTLFQGQSGSFTLTYSCGEAGGFNYSLSNSGTVTVAKTGGNAFGQNTITKTLITGPTQSVNLSVAIAGSPAGVSTSIASQGCSPACTSVITFTVAPNAPNGTYLVTVTGTPLNKTTQFNLVITGNPISVTCIASPQVAKISEQVTWTATANGGEPPYTYRWSGTNIPVNPAPTANPYSISYNTVGQKSAVATVTDSNSVSSSCLAATAQINLDPLYEEF